MKTIHHVVDVDAEPDRLWWALTEPVGMAGWWTTRVDSPPPSVGAVTRWTFAGDFNPEMEITALDKSAILTWRCVGGHEPWQDNTFRFEFSPLEEARSRLRFWQEYAVELADDAYGTYNFNWGYYLESLRLLCATGTGMPFQADR
jgi:uncharacterized protein YndB with AHSA1/START domain